MPETPSLKNLYPLPAQKPAVKLGDTIYEDVFAQPKVLYSADLYGEAPARTQLSDATLYGDIPAGTRLDDDSLYEKPAVAGVIGDQNVYE